MKVIFITATLTIIWLMRKHKTVSHTYSKEEDTFKLAYLGTCFVDDHAAPGMSEETRQSKHSCHLMPRRIRA